jgi:hypothetical protein
MYYLLLLSGIGGSQKSKRPKRETATHVVKGLGKALSCSTHGRVFGAWYLTIGSLHFVCFGRSVIAL